MKLIPFTRTDIPVLVSWIDHPEVSLFWAYKTYPYPLTEEKVLKHLARSEAEDAILRIYKICENNMAVGHIEIDGIDFESNCARISRLYIKPEHRSKGLAEAAIRKVHSRDIGYSLFRRHR